VSAQQRELTKEERSLLLYLESCLVDHHGYINAQRINIDDRATLKAWDEAGYVHYGRLPMWVIQDRYRQSKHTEHESHYVRFSEAAWQDAHRERRQRSERLVNDHAQRYDLPGATMEHEPEHADQSDHSA
jgi:hypothetical protein